MEKENKIVNWLRTEQERLQKEFKRRTTKQRRSIYNLRGVWISPTCACGNEFRTPFHIRDNGTCPKCNKLFCRAMKTDKYVKELELNAQKSTTTSKKKSGHNSSFKK